MLISYSDWEMLYYHRYDCAGRYGCVVRIVGSGECVGWDVCASWEDGQSPISR